MVQVKCLTHKNILIASLQPWYSPLVSKQFISLELAKIGNWVTFLNIKRILAGAFLNQDINRKKFHRIYPERLRLKTLHVVRGFLRNRALYQLAKSYAKRTLGTSYYPDVIFSFDPQFCLLHELFPKALRIYYCVDHVASDKILEEAQERILAHTDLVVVSSKQLYKDFEGKHPNVNYLPHGVDLLDEYEDKGWKNKIDHWFHDLGHGPVFGFLGYLSSQIDFQLVDFIARENSEATIALVGPQSLETKNIITQLPKNILCTGPIPATCAKYCLSNFDVGMVPYKNNQFNSRRNPIKVMQYIASGLPVVTTGIGEDFNDSRLVHRCITHQEFNDTLIEAYKTDYGSRLSLERIQWKEKNSWLERIKLLDQLVCNYYNHNESQLKSVVAEKE